MPNDENQEGLDSLSFLYDPGVEDIDFGEKDSQTVTETSSEETAAEQNLSFFDNQHQLTPDNFDFLQDTPEDEVDKTGDEIIETGDEQDKRNEDVEDLTKRIGDIAKYFADKGVLLLEENEEADKIEWTEQKFIEKFEDSVEENAWLKLEELATEALGERGVEFIKDVFINKVPYTDYLRSYQKEDAVETLDPETHGERIIRYYLSAQGVDEEDIDEQIAFYKGNETLAAKAGKFKSLLVQNVKKEREAFAGQQKIQQEALIKREQERASAYAKTVQEAIKAGTLNGLPLNRKDGEELYNYTLDKPHTLPNGQKLTEFEYKLARMKYEDPSKFLTIARLVMTDIDLSVVKRAEQTERTESLFKENKAKPKSLRPKDGDIYSSIFKNIPKN